MSREYPREEMSDRGSGSGMAAAPPLYTNVNTHPAAGTLPDEYGQHLEYAPSRRTGCCGIFQRIGQGAIGVVHRIVPPGGIVSGAFNMASASIGAGILGLPAAADSAGLILAMMYLVVITYFSVFSMYILALAAQSTRIKSFEGMARWLFPYGNYAFSYWAAFIRLFHSFASCVAYVISLGNCLGAIFRGAYKKQPDNHSLKYLASTQGNRVITSMVWLCVMVPLVVPKHIDSLRYASAIAVTFMVYFVIVVVVHSCRHGLPENVHHVKLSGNQVNDASLTENTVFLFRTGNSVINSVGVFMFAYVCQINAYEIFWDFRPEIRTTKNYTWSAFIGMMLCGTLYVLVCVFGYFDFGSQKLLGKSLLLMFDPLEEADLMVAYVGVLIKLCVAYALLTLAARNSIYYLIGWQHKYRTKRDVGAGAATPPFTASMDDLAAGAPRQTSQDVLKPTLPGDAPASAAAEPSFSLQLDNAHSMYDDNTNSAAKKQPGAGFDNDGAPLTVDEADKEPGEDDSAEDITFVDNIPFWKHLLVVLIISVAALLCGLFIPNINTVFGFAGSISGAFMAFVFPALFFMYSGNFSLGQVGWFTYLNTYILLICGVVGIVFGTGGTIYDTIS